MIDGRKMLRHTERSDLQRRQNPFGVARKAAKERQAGLPESPMAWRLSRAHQ